MNVMTPFIQTEALQGRSSLPIPETRPASEHMDIKGSGFSTVLKQQMKSEPAKDEQKKTETNKPETAAAQKSSSTDSHNVKKQDEHSRSVSEKSMAEEQTAQNKKAGHAEKKSAKSDPKKTDKKQLAADAEQLKEADNSDTLKPETKKDLTALLDGLLQNILHMKNADPAQKKQLTDEIKDLKADLSMKGGRQKNINARLKHILALLEKFTAKNPQASKSFAEELSRLKQIAKNIESKTKRPEHFHPDQKHLAHAAEIKQDHQDVRDRPQTAASDSAGSDASASIKTETSSDSKTGLSFQFSKNQNAAQTNVQNQAGARSAGAKAFDQQLQGILDNAKIYVKNSRNGSFQVNLHPKELGKINVNLGLEHGILHGKFLVDSPEAKDMLTGNLSQIRQQLQDAGITVGDFQVNVRSQQQQSQNREHEEMLKFSGLPSENEEIRSVYDANAMDAYDGSINMVI